MLIYIKLSMHRLKLIVTDNLYKFNHFKMNISRTFKKICAIRALYFISMYDIF